MTTIAIDVREEIKELLPQLREMKAKQWFIEKEVKQFAEKLEKVLVYTNAKVYDASWYACDDWKKDFPILTQDEVDSAFSLFLETEWQNFEEEEFFKDIVREQLGRTSSFRMVGSQLSELDTSIHGSSDYHGQLVEMLELEELDIKYYLDDCYESLAEAVENFIDEQDRILDNAEYILDGMKDEFKNARRLYQSLESFKKNQVDYLKSFLECSAEDVEMDEPERRLEVINFTSYQKEEKFEFSATIDVHKTLLEGFLSKFDIAIELDGKACRIDYAVALNLITWLGSQDTNEYYSYNQSIQKTNGN